MNPSGENRTPCLRMHRSTPIALVVGLTLLAGCGTNSTVNQIAPSKTKSARLETAKEEWSEPLFEASGTLRARLNATLSSKVTSLVRTVNIQEGQSFRKGQVLMLLDDEELGSAESIADANYRASIIGVKNATTAAEMENRSSKARIDQARAQLQEAKAQQSLAQSKLDLTLAGPRSQERTQAHLAVEQAQSNLKLAKSELDRSTQLESEGALSKRQLEVAENAYEMAQAQFRTALESEKIATEGSRSQEVRAAQDEAKRAEAAVKQADAELSQAKASALQAQLKKSEIDTAKAQVSQSSAALRAAKVGRAYSQILAPFDCRIVKRIADPGMMAGPGIPLAIVEGGEFRLEASVPESVLASVHVGAPMAVKIDATLQEFEGRVAEISPQGNPTSHVYIVKVSLPGVSGLRSGMFGRIEIAQKPRKTLFVPAGATWAKEGLHYLYVVDQGAVARLRIVNLGHVRSGKVEVLSGLVQGERIVAEGWDKVDDGDKVIGN